MMLQKAVLLLPLLFLVGIQTNSPVFDPIKITVQNKLMNRPNENFSTSVRNSGVLLGAMNRLMSSNSGFKFTFTEDPDFGPFLESVNGLAGNDKNRTYWELLVKNSSDIITRLEVGIGCFQPKAHDEIILNYNKW